MCPHGLGGIWWLWRNPKAADLGSVAGVAGGRGTSQLSCSEMEQCGGGEVELRNPLLLNSIALIEVWPVRHHTVRKNLHPLQSETKDFAKVVLQEVDAGDTGELLGSQAKPLSVSR